METAAGYLLREEISVCHPLDVKSAIIDCSRLIATWCKVLAFSRWFTLSDVEDRPMERPVTEKLIDRGERLGLHTHATYLYISPFSLDLFHLFSIPSGRFHKFVRKDVRHRVKLVRRLRKNLYLFDTFHAIFRFVLYTDRYISLASALQ